MAESKRHSSSVSITPSPSISTIDDIDAPVADLPKNVGAAKARDVEAQRTPQEKAAHWQLVVDQTHVTPAVLNHKYRGSGTAEDPFIVEYIPNDRRNPMLFPKWKKWTITLLAAFVHLPPLLSIYPRISTNHHKGHISNSIRLLRLHRRHRPNNN